ncbi:cold-inducible protein YdjO-related protein [Cytobacillus sp. Hm23]|uniref:cold-inducible protein YdjO-related protein n=1 Tax=Bacillaceae TaxID=186817 RepID=UPI002A125F95|nr:MULTISPECIES: cold-inducible protein YdjO-related protein [unclassified Cytobacillus]MDX8360205.1 cold-inducible protein YdjO-related protein [Cytobacillus sp. IB215316]MDX8366998.1 cold-inducible protein YdjO-related protein [Cytobacillus sp. IB215665]
MVFGKKVIKEIETEETKIWVCSSELCNCWVRDNFRSKDQTTCPACNSEMEMAFKELEIVHNNSIIS